MIVARLRPALLEVPPFHPAVPWLSEQIAAEHHPDGTIGPGSMARALMQPYGSDRADEAARSLVAARVGGRYWAPAEPQVLAAAGFGLAVVVATADETESRAMLAAAFERASAARTLLLIPASGSPALRRHALRAGCLIADSALDPWAVLDAASELHVASTDPIGILALLAGLTLHCHRPTWFSGRRHPDRLAASCLLDGAQYTNPFTGLRCSVHEAIDLAVEWRRVCVANRGIAVTIGMQFWKRRRMSQFLHDGARAPRPARSPAAAIAAARESGAAIAAWASRIPPGLAAQAQTAGVKIVRVEDGFLRSVGLGSDFLPPCSIVLDHSGLYYDSHQPSDLEDLLATTEFGPALLARAAAVIGRVTQAGLTKYNVGKSALPPLPTDRPLILVVGQVADDLSVQLGAAAVTGNADLLHRVRAANPAAFILYRPHPDVDAGHRAGAIADTDTLRLADSVARGIPMAALIGAVDEIHTMTSLAGFEALLRGRRVTVWGRPFYAGWGLTTDMAPIPRRTRRLLLDELAAGVLLLYPRYLDPVTALPCPAEVLIDRLATPQIWHASPLVRLRRLQGRVIARLQTTRLRTP